MTGRTLSDFGAVRHSVNEAIRELERTAAARAASRKIVDMTI